MLQKEHRRIRPSLVSKHTMNKTDNKLEYKGRINCTQDLQSRFLFYF